MSHRGRAARYAEDDPDDDPYDPDDEEGSWDTAAAVIPCPACGAEMAEESIRCPACGHYRTEEDAPSTQKPWVIWVALALAGTLTLAALRPWL